MLKVAITGNIASGKSEVEKMLLNLGFKVADTDKINHFILMSDYSAILEIKNAFKDDDILDDGGAISREKLGRVVFSSLEKKLKLEEILHKRIFQKVEEFFQENDSKDVVFVSIPLLFETNQQDMFDKIIFVSADEDIRVERLMKRNNYSREYALNRMNSQGDELEKIKKSDFVIYNNSDFLKLKSQVKSVLEKLLNW